MRRVALWWCLALFVVACDEGALGNAPITAEPTQANAVQNAQPPFEVTGDLDGLILSWFDAQGLHNANKRSDVPEHRRAQVRVDSLNVAPDDRLDPSLVYIADLRAPQANGSYAVHTLERAAFDALVDKAAGVSIQVPAPNPDQPGQDNANSAHTDRPVIIYKASWCGACKAAAAYLRQRGVAFEERDVETDRNANTEMQHKAQAAGVSPRGVPVIDFRGTLVLGFDKQRLSQLIDRTPI